MSLAEVTWSLLNRALEAYGDSPQATAWLRRHLARFHDPVRLAVVGPARAGKSTVVNALAGELVAEPGVPDTELSWYQVRQSRSRQELLLLDTPPVDRDTESRVVEGICMEADAVLYLMRHPQDADLAFLRAVQDHPVARAAPVTALGVLSRADELGGGRVDAIVSARQIARRHRREPGLSGLCQDVLPVAGLAACAGRTLREDEFELLAALAALPKQELDPLLLSADRFAADEARAALLERFGLFGVRLATTLVRRGARGQAALSAQLLQRSGLGELRDAVELYFTDRADVLKARSALIGLEVVLRMEPRPAAGPLLAELERTVAGAHEFRELRLIAALRTGRVRLPEELSEEAFRLVGGYGGEASARLGFEAAEAAGPALRHEAVGALRRWQEYAGNPLLGAAERRAAAVVIRSCEALATS
ncbi:50S ribosome-binding GTPase [Prauserella shujinwangii]|uniref:50S ribosome-binding GTPase n=1 Tax=Prauserella shujinwangii TaxID=1453103 RepID=A0A2T0LN99_9PSEU|nr:GTPase [Prauserella shujinwangii]PRX44665.1 50S ribosome-binding GTPase [Prauserella shujinwangii]